MTGPILGRTDELRQVFAFLDDDTPGARAVVLSGQAGIGKTTIWRAGLRHAEELGLRALVAQPAESEAGLPYAGLADLFATVTDDALDRLPPQQRAAVGAALARTAPAGPLDQHALARGTVELLAGAASDGPLLVAIDDVQWLDAPTAAALAFGLRRLESASLRVLVSMRTETGRRPDSPLGLESWEQPPRWIDVGPLAPTELGALLREALGEDLPRPRVELLARASGGNPMFALELARQPATGTAAPASLTQTLATRIGELVPAGQAAVTIAAAALQPSIDLLLQAGVEEQGIRSAVDAGILVRDGDGLSFAHPLLASAAYEACSRASGARCTPGSPRSALARSSRPTTCRAPRPARAKAPRRRSRRPRESRPSSETTPAPPRSSSERPSSRPTRQTRRPAGAAPARPRSSKRPETSRRRQTSRAPSGTSSRPARRGRSLAGRSCRRRSGRPCSTRRRSPSSPSRSPTPARTPSPPRASTSSSRT